MSGYFDFTGKKILVAGASSGIGRTTAILLSKLGCEVYLVARRQDCLKEVIAQMSGGSHDFFSFDLSDIDAIQSLFERIKSKHGQLDGFVYSVGIYSSIPLLQSKHSKIEKVFNTNFYPFVECVRQLSRKGNHNKGCRVVGVSSAASLRGYKAKLAYSSSKAAMDAAVRCMARELSTKEIYINSVAPGLTSTELYYKESLGGEDGSIELTNRQYLGIATPSDIADVIVFLLSNRSRFINGATIPVDGGLLSS